MHKTSARKHFPSRGVSLTELMIALLILAEIATFTIPKVLTSQQNHRNKAIAKEAVAMISEAYQAYLLKRDYNWRYMRTTDLYPYLNYVKLETTNAASVDGWGAGGWNCPGLNCVRLHNGAILYSWGEYFCNSGGETSVQYWLDPNGVQDGNTRALVLFLNSKGRVFTQDGLNPKADAGWGGGGNCDKEDWQTSVTIPAWFSW